MDQDRRPIQKTRPWTPDTSGFYSRRVAVLDRRSARVVERAHDAGVPITYVGVTPVFAEPRVYEGPQTDWVVSPVTDLSDAVVPRTERAALVRLAEAGIEFPMIYIAHEIPKGRLAIRGSDSEPCFTGANLDHATAQAAVGPTPPPAATTALANRLGRSSQVLLHVLGMAIPVAGAIVAAPFVLAGAAVAAIGTLTLDPIIFGVIPAGPPVPGQPGAWYILARWDWPSAPAITGDPMEE